MTMPSEAAILAWARLMRVHATALGTVERGLKAAGLPPLEWYDVLLELERHGPLRPRELQARLLLAQYNLSRLVDRMAEAAVVERQPCEDDRRGHLLAITQEGRALRRTMWPVYAAGIEAAVGSRIEEGSLGMLSALLARLMEPGESGEPG